MKKSFTMAAGCKPVSYLGCRLAFTMAEILISLTIIGIIAAITLPSLVGNINKKTFATKRKALHSRMTQAIALMPSLNGYGIGADDNETAEKATQAFITDGLSKVLKISNICDSENLKKCGFPDKFTKMGINSKIDAPKTIRGLNRYFVAPNGTYLNYSQVNTNSAAFETVNGESVLTFYNPNCSYTYGYNNPSDSYYRGQNLMQPTMCANFIYDLNGRKGPNKVGKDIGFMTVFYPTDSEIAAPMPTGQAYVYKSDNNSEFSIGLGNKICHKKYGDETKMANIAELKSVFVNNALGEALYDPSYHYFLEGTSYTSSTYASSSAIYQIQAFTGRISDGAAQSFGSDNRRLIFCVKR